MSASVSEELSLIKVKEGKLISCSILNVVEKALYSEATSLFRKLDPGGGKQRFDE